MPDDEHGNPLTQFLRKDCQIKVGFSAAKTMVQFSKTEQTLKEIENYSLEILAVLKVSWTDTGTETLNGLN